MKAVCIDCKKSYFETHPKRKKRRCEDCNKLYRKAQKDKHHHKKNNQSLIRNVEMPIFLDINILSMVEKYLDNESKYNLYKTYGNIFKTKCSSCTNIAKFISITLEDIPCDYYCGDFFSEKNMLDFSCQINCPKSHEYDFDEILNTKDKYTKLGHRLIDNDECACNGKRQMYEIKYEICMI